jgi:hypothetical protein
MRRAVVRTDAEMRVQRRKERRPDVLCALLANGTRRRRTGLRSSRARRRARGTAQGRARRAQCARTPRPSLRTVRDPSLGGYTARSATGTRDGRRYGRTDGASTGAGGCGHHRRARAARRSRRGGGAAAGARSAGRRAYPKRTRPKTRACGPSPRPGELVRARVHPRADHAGRGLGEQPRRSGLEVRTEAERRRERLDRVRRRILRAWECRRPYDSLGAGAGEVRK